MATINVNRQGTATGAVSSSFNTARTSNAASVDDGNTGASVYVQYFSNSGRGGGTKRFKRMFLHFDTSGITGTVSAAHIDIDGHLASADPNDSILVKSTAFGGDGGTALATTDFFSSIDYGTPYSTELTTWSTGNNEYTLTSAALADIKNNDSFTLALVEHDSDFTNSDQITNGASDISINLGTTITLDFTEEAASGYTHNVIGVAAASIGKVSSVAAASIGKINSVD
jgi:hypothetical protein|tara:strand:- start:27 stop:710 length:684 start_codon:yes stop_codon:yes gene_type:complete